MTPVELAPAGAPAPVPAPSLEVGAPATGATRHMIRGSSLLLAGRLIAMGLNFAVQVITVRYLAKSDYGAFAYGMGVVSTGATAVLLGMDKAATRFAAMYQEQHDPRRMMATIALAVTTVWGVGLSLVVAFHGARGLLAERVVADPVAMSLLLILIALVPVSAFDSLLQRLLAVFIGARAIFFRRHLLGPGLKLATVLVVVAAGGSVRMLAWGYLVGGLLGIGAYAAVLIRRWRAQGLLTHLTLRPRELTARPLFLYALPLLSSELVLVLRDSLAVILLGQLRTSSEVAEYQAVLPVAKLNLFVMQSFSMLFLPMASRLFARQDRPGLNHLYWQTTLWIAVMSFPAVAATAILAGPIVELLFGARYAVSGPVLAILALGHYFHASLGFNATTLRVCDKARYIFAIDGAALVLGVALNLLLIPRYGALGAAIGTTGTFLVHNALTNLGLHLSGTGVKAIQWRFLQVYAAVAAGLAGLALVHGLLDPPLYVSAVLVAAVSLALIRATRGIVRPAETFPELLRIPLLRRLLGTDAPPRGPRVRHQTREDER